MAGMTDDFDPVGLAEIAAMTDPPVSAQHARYVMGLEGAPEPVALARMKVWRRSEVAPYLDAYAARLAAGWRPVPRDPGTGRFHREA
jgi:hypothetical protein